MKTFVKGYSFLILNSGIFIWFLCLTVASFKLLYLCKGLISFNYGILIEIWSWKSIWICLTRWLISSIERSRTKIRIICLPCYWSFKRLVLGYLFICSQGSPYESALNKLAFISRLLWVIIHFLSCLVKSDILVFCVDIKHSRCLFFIKLRINILRCRKMFFLFN